MKRMSTWGAVVGACLLAMAAGPAIASESIPFLRPVPASLAPDVRQHLTDERAALSEVFRRLKSDVDTFKKACANVEDGTAADAKCASEDAGLEARRSEYIKHAKAYNTETTTALEARIASLTGAIHRDEQAIRNLRVGKSGAQFTDWVEISSDAQKERDEQFKEALHGAGEQILEAASANALEHGLDRVASLNPPKANRLISELRNAGVTDPYVEELLRSIASTPGKPQKVRSAQALIHRLEQMHHVWNLEDMSDTSDSAKWRAGAEVLGIFVDDPRMRLIGMLTLDTVRASFYSVHNNIVRQVALSQIEDLTRLTELQLQDLKILSAKLQNDVKALHDAKRELAQPQ